MPSIFGAFCPSGRSLAELTDVLFEASASRGGSSRLTHITNNFSLGARGESDDADFAIVANLDKSVVAVIEGEIYNTSELSSLLGLSKPLSADDSGFDLIVPLFEKFGESFPRHINGIFAIALVDINAESIYLVRDHLGSRSLFYSTAGGMLTFSSTIRSLLKTGIVRPTLSLDSLNSYFCSTAISPPDTLFQDVFSVRPGAMVRYKAGQIQDHDYWPIKDISEDYETSMDEFAEQVRTLIIDSVSIRTRNNKPYGCLMSGGLDTSVVSAILMQTCENRRLPVFSISFNELSYSDSQLQQLMCDRYNFDAHTLVLSPRDYEDTLKRAVVHLDSPVNDIAMVGMYKAFEMAKKYGCKAVFEGEAADELFYTGHAHAEREFQKHLVIPYWFRKLLLGNTLTYMPIGDTVAQKILRRLYRIGLSDEERRLIVLPSFYRHKTPILLPHKDLRNSDPFSTKRRYLAETSARDPLNIYYYGLLKSFLPDDLLFKNERMAAAHGIMNRTPFIDYRLVELAYRIPQKLKIKAPTKVDDGTKLVYKKAVRGLVPDEILKRKKTRGFSHPSAPWYRNELNEFVHETLLSKDALCHDFVNKAYMHKLFTDHLNGMNADYLLNSLVIFELWLQAFLK